MVFLIFANRAGQQPDFGHEDTCGFPARVEYGGINGIPTKCPNVGTFWPKVGEILVGNPICDNAVYLCDNVVTH